MRADVGELRRQAEVAPKAGICRVDLKIGYVAKGAGSSRMLDFGNQPASGLMNELCQRLSASA